MGILIIEEVQVANDTMFQTCGKIMANGYLPLDSNKAFHSDSKSNLEINAKSTSAESSTNRF
jgi:hypothetical protein